MRATGYSLELEILDLHNADASVFGSSGLGSQE